jgi:hypothetical protein
MHRIFLAAILAAFPIIAVAAGTLAPSALIAGASTYNGQTVTVGGKVSNFMSKSTALGQFTAFQLCDSQCVNVLDKTSQAHGNGTMATVTGTFHSTFKAPHKTWTNTVTIGM